ncbi:MAG: hypothetical protein BWY99_02635 [Synergistetes bacterium ADurb.BinA166]|nr:MAG: hypothetical protein BWY99_02635 [Synergistetes bacterium ADurb.BinA166]
MVEIHPGETFFDKMPDGRFEKCILRKLPDGERDKAAARGGTGEFFRPIPKDQMTAARIEAAEEMIWDAEVGVFVLLEKCVD